MRVKASQLDRIPGLNSKKQKIQFIDGQYKQDGREIRKTAPRSQTKPWLLLTPYFNIGTNTPIYSNRNSCGKLVPLEFIFPPNSKNLEVKNT